MSNDRADARITLRLPGDLHVTLSAMADAEHRSLNAQIVTMLRQETRLRDSFIAHAPAEPQAWFRPVMSMDHPSAPARLTELTDAERKELDGLDEFYGAEHCQQPRVREYGLARDAAKKAGHEWDREHEKQRYVQWPAAWADEMLKARSA